MYGEGADAYAAEVRQRKEWLAAMTPTERANYNRAMIPQSPPPPRELRPDEVEYILPGLEALEKARGRYFRYNNNYKPDTKEWTPFTSGYGPLITPTITYLLKSFTNKRAFDPADVTIKMVIKPGWFSSGNKIIITRADGTMLAIKSNSEDAELNKLYEALKKLGIKVVPATGGYKSRRNRNKKRRSTRKTRSTRKANATK